MFFFGKKQEEEPPVVQSIHLRAPKWLFGTDNPALKPAPAVSPLRPPPKETKASKVSCSLQSYLPNFSLTSPSELLAIGEMRYRPLCWRWYDSHHWSL